MEDVVWIWIALGAGLAALILAYYYAGQVMRAPQGSDRMKEISAAISEGANAFLRREYTWVAIFVAVLTILIFVLLDWGWWAGGVAYIFGAALSAFAGFVGMRVATAANARTTEAARTGGIEKALPLAFRGGAVMGFTVSLFITELAFSDPLLTDEAKIGIFIGSAVAGVLGYLLLRFKPAREPSG